MIAAAGSGKTTFLVKDALGVTDKNVLITTYTEANRVKCYEIQAGWFDSFVFFYITFP